MENSKEIIKLKKTKYWSSIMYSEYDKKSICFNLNNIKLVEYQERNNLMLEDEDKNKIVKHYVLYICKEGYIFNTFKNCYFISFEFIMDIEN